MNKRGITSLAQLLIAASIATGVTVLVGQLVKSGKDAEGSAMLRYASLEMRRVYSSLSQDPGAWIRYQLRADSLLDSSRISNCLRVEGAPYTCPGGETPSDPTILREARGREIYSAPVYAPKRAGVVASMSAGDFLKVSGTAAQPVYFDRDGVVCADAASNRCLRKVTSYLMLSLDTKGNPSAAVYLVKQEQNPATIAKFPGLVRPTYTKINVGTLWKGKAPSAFPIGGIASFGGPESQIPEGYLPCDGRDYDRSDYPELYAVIGTQWTPPGAAAPSSTKFHVPDLRGQYLRGLDLTGGATTPVDPDRATRTVGSFQLQQIDNRHDHGAMPIAATFADTAASGSVSAGFSDVTGSPLPVTISGFARFISGPSVYGCGGLGLQVNSAASASGTVNLSAPATGIVATLPSPGSSAALTFAPGVGTGLLTVMEGVPAAGVEVRPPTAFVHYIIKAKEE